MCQTGLDSPLLEQNVKQKVVLYVHSLIEALQHI
jgi:hypothetical protein